MEVKLAQFANRGMNQDISVSKATNEFAFRNYNIRITAVNDNTLLSITNEKLPSNKDVQIRKKGLISNKITRQGVVLQSEYPVETDVTIKVDYTEVATGIKSLIYYTLNKGETTVPINTRYITIDSIKIDYPKTDNKYAYYIEGEEIPNYKEEIISTINGNFIGYCIIGEYIVIFTTGDKDRIYSLKYNNNKFEGLLLYEGNLNFDSEHLIETLPYYESEEIQKVYWVDNKNITRFINIKGNIKHNDDTQFDFSPTINKFPTVEIEKQYNSKGLFPSGIIQYFISYYNKFGAETGIVWSSDLQYISEKTVGESPENTVICNFNLYLKNIDVNFDYVRIYSIIRTSLDGEPQAAIVKDIPIQGKNTLSYSDYNLNNEVIDPSMLLFLNANNIIASTINQKDNTLFLGNLKIKDVVIDSNIIDVINSNIEENENSKCYRGLKFKYKKFYGLEDNDYQLLNSSKKISTFKKGEWYRFAIQFQDSLGVWAQPIFIGDLLCTLSPIKQGNEFLVADAVLELHVDLKNTIKDKYVNYRLLMAETSHATRSILAQGIVSPTLFNHAERVNNSGPYSIASWIMRPRNGNAQFEHLGGLGNIKTTDGYKNISTCEIQNSLEAYPAVKITDGSELTNNFYVDNSIINFYSPDIKNNESLFKDTDLKFRIIGVAPVTNITSDIILNTETSGKYSGATLIKNATNIKRTSGITRDRVPSEEQDNTDLTINDIFINRPVYLDALLSEDGNFTNNTAKYYIYLWNKKGSLIGQTSETKESSKEDAELANLVYSSLKHKIIANKRVCNNINYFNSSNILNYTIKPTVFNSNEIESKILDLVNTKSIYQGNYETLLATRAEDTTNKIDYSYRVFFTDPNVITVSGPRPSGIGNSSNSSNRINYNYINLEQYDPVSIKYKTTEHLAFSLNGDSIGEYKILPYLKDNNEKAWDIKNVYSEEYFNYPEGDIKYPWFKNNEYYSQDVIEGINIGDNPYFYIGEVYRDLDNITAYGSLDNITIQKLNWLPISIPTKIEDNVLNTIGDTYFQRWDCLASYPFTEEDMNSVVDITSFMLETHVNLDGRYDVNKELNNIINSRPTNFNLINEVYSQKNNYFSYNILDEKFKQTDYTNQITYSLQKTPTSNVDIWTNISSTSAFNLNGLYGKLNRIINFNDTLLTFQDKAIGVINFNNYTALSTESGVPIEIANSGKVNGYSVITSTTGCQNKWSICDAPSGVYFIDDYNKTMMRFNKEGLNNISSNGLSIWFKNNLTSKERIFNDCITGDIYVINENDCIVYNEALQSFVSFMDYNNINVLFNLNKNSFIFNKENKFLKMFEGNYCNNYSIEYKINPEPYSYNTFTNVEFTADCLKDTFVDNIPTRNNLNNVLPFNKLEVWNEYQYGKTNIKDRFIYPNFENKFRKWRIDIPRDSYSKNSLGRIKNPWILLKLYNDVEHNDKIVFHNLVVKYYN